MPLLLKSSIKRAYAESLLNDIADNRNQYFLFVAKTTEWGATAGASADIIPQTPQDTVLEEYDVMRSVVGYKKLDPSKIVFALPRIPWTNGDFYDVYDDNVSLFDPDDPKQFYTVTSANHIYKCVGLPPPTVPPTPSSVQPTHTTSTAVKYSDGYTWKYLATVKESQLPYELVDYVPINYVKVEQDALGDAADTETTLQFNAQKSAVNGQITRVELVTNGGASAATYLGSEYGARFAIGATGTTASNASFGVGDYFTIQSSTTTNQFTLPVSDISQYIGYMLRVVGVCGSATNASDVNKYGVIHGVTASSNQYTFTVRGDFEPFFPKVPGGSNQVYFDIIPYARVSGDGEGAYCFVTVGKTGESNWRQISAVELINGGENYSQAIVEVVSPKSDGSSTDTVHPTIRTVLSPKGGHASNILKELNVSDVIMIAEINVDDEDIITPGGSYRIFGIIKNPNLNDGSDTVAGSDSLYYRDLILLYLGASYSTATQFQNNYFDGSAYNFITGAETFATFPVVGDTPTVSTLNGETRVQIKVKNTGANPITWFDRLNNYELSLSPAKSGFLVGETITQSIPAGISIGILGGISYAFGITAEGTLTKVSNNKLSVRVRKNNFVSGSSSTLAIRGALSGVTALIGGVSLAYGELAVVSKGLSFASEGGSTAELFKFISASTPYFQSAAVPSYSGLTTLTMTKGTLSDFTDTTWSNGDFIEQGLSGSYIYDYASAYVYKWERTSTSSGKLYVTEPFGIFKTSAVEGASLASLNDSSGNINAGYIVAGVSAPAIDIHSGEIVYINSIQPVQRLQNQTEEFRLRIGF